MDNFSTPNKFIDPDYQKNLMVKWRIQFNSDDCKMNVVETIKVLCNDEFMRQEMESRAPSFWTPEEIWALCMKVVRSGWCSMVMLEHNVACAHNDILLNKSRPLHDLTLVVDDGHIAFNSHEQTWVPIHTEWLKNGYDAR